MKILNKRHFIPLLLTLLLAFMMVAPTMSMAAESTGSLTVTMVVKGNAPNPSWFAITATGAYGASYTTGYNLVFNYTGGSIPPQTIDNLLPGRYTITERRVGNGWSTTLPVSVTVANGDTAVVVTNTYSKVRIFSDVPASYWGYNAISSLSSPGIVSGYQDGTFKPDASITRAEFATMLVRALGLDTSGQIGNYTDVTPDAWYYATVNAAASAGLVAGTGDNLFAPNDLINREQMAVMLTNALGTKAPAVDGTELNTFNDQTAVSSWAVKGMAEAVKAGIVSGTTASTLAPLENATRAEAAQMIYKMLSVSGK